MTEIQPIHDPPHEDWVVARLAGETLAPDAARAIEACATCRETVARVSDFEADLRVAGRVELTGMTAAFPAASDPAATAMASPPHRLRPMLRVAAAAVVLVGIGFAIRFATRPQEPYVPPTRDDGPALHVAGATALVPSGEVESVTTFTWSGELPPGGRFLVRVLRTKYDPVAPDGFLFGSLRITERRWTPERAELEKLPPAFRWTVSVLDVTGTEISSASADVTIVPH